MNPSDRPTGPSVPNWRFMCVHPAHLVAFAGGAGLSPKAPGTVGTLWAWLCWHLFAAELSLLTQSLLVGLGFVLGLWACKVCATHLSIADPSAIVWDEVIAFWFVLMVLGQATLFLQLMAFLLFRFFDAAKPPPVSWADRTFKGFGYLGAFGIMFDDLVAAACTLLVLALSVRIAFS
jgi:phosphatidylglycerophosphatase A